MENRISVLVVDDTPQDLEIVGQYLEEIADVDMVMSGQEALKHVKIKKPDVILLDVKMPIMDGFQTVEELRKIEEGINVPIIMVSSMGDKETVLNSVAMGIDGYLLKPLSKEVLQEKVQEVYRSKNETHEEKKTILMIDDDMSYLKQMHSMLCDTYNVVIINSAKLALEYLVKNIPDVVVLDYQMPLYSGASMMRLIQTSVPDREIPIIILSGALNREILEECYSYNPVACLAKPVSREILEENIEHALYG